jgi:hypothetical protein
MGGLSVAFSEEKYFYNFVTVAHHPNLKKLFLWVCQTFGEPVVTSAFRENDPGVHGTTPLRGLDIRSAIYSNPQNVEDSINCIWIYDPERPEMKCAMLHDTGGGIHIHLQVHLNTRKA